MIPDLSGQIIIVTGGNSGIGRETVKVLLQHNAKVYLAARNKQKAEEVINQLKEETGGREAIFLVLDLSSLASVRKAAEEFLNKEHTLNVLFNNAGVMASPIDMVTVDGYDAQFGTNVIGHWLFTELLTPALLAGTETSPDHHSRVVTTSSAAAMLDTIYFDALKDGPARRKRGHQLYAQSKFGNVVVARQVAKRYGDKGIISLSVDPGAIQSDLNRHILEESRGIKGVLVRAWFKAVLRPPSFGALTQLWAGTMPEALSHNGEYLVPTAQIAPADVRRMTTSLARIYGAGSKKR